MLSVSDKTVAEFQIRQAGRLAQQIFSAAPTIGSAEIAQHYVNEALSVGIATDRDIAEFAMLLAPIDRSGRPAHIVDLVQDRQTDGALKVFQIYYALHGERP